MERKNDIKLEELRKKNIPIYSISRLDTINNCAYEAYRTYILGDRGENNIYALMGSKIHDVLQGITDKTHTEADLLPAMREELEDMDLMGIQFPKGRDGNDSIRNKWIADMTHFCTTYKAPRGNLKAEELIIYKSPNNNYLQGYIDLQRVRSDGSVDIYDYKTSSLYKGNAITEHQRQLIVYALGKRQEGVRVNSINWIFLKYVNVKFTGKKSSKSKNETQINKTIERCNIGKELEDYIAGWLEEEGIIDAEQQMLLDEIRRTNKLDCLPESVRSRISITPCVISAELTDESIKDTEEYIDSTIRKWEQLSNNEIDYPPRSFTKTTKSGKESSDIFFCTNLCGHYKKCPHIKDYLITLENNDEETDLFGNV